MKFRSTPYRDGWVFHALDPYGDAYHVFFSYHGGGWLLTSRGTIGEPVTSSRFRISRKPEVAERQFTRLFRTWMRRYARDPKPRSKAQKERQFHRERGGKYKKFNPCEVCGKSVGQEYFSDSRCSTELEGRGVTLHERCADRLARLPAHEARKLLVH